MRAPPGIPAWPLAIAPGRAPDCQPSGILRSVFPGWRGESCGVLSPDATQAQLDAAFRCVMAANAAGRPFVELQAERARGGMIFGIGYFKEAHGDVYRVTYMDNPCAETPTPCFADGSTSLVRCTKLGSVCDHANCFACEGQELVGSCRAGGP